MIRASSPPGRRSRPTGSGAAPEQSIAADTTKGIPELLRRRRKGAARCVPLDCGCRDPWPCRCTFPPLTDHGIDGYAKAARHILATTGRTPILPIEVLRALYRRGGDDRVLAVELHTANGGQAA